MRRPLAVRATPPRSGALLWTACCAGREPAEALDPRDREDLVADLDAAGWTLHEIAVHTRMTTYTTGRIAVRVRGGTTGLDELEAEAARWLAPAGFTARDRRPWLPTEPAACPAVPLRRPAGVITPPPAPIPADDIEESA
jgi:hypothetical protein